MGRERLLSGSRPSLGSVLFSESFSCQGASVLGEPLLLVKSLLALTPGFLPSSKDSGAWYSFCSLGLLIQKYRTWICDEDDGCVFESPCCGRVAGPVVVPIRSVYTQVAGTFGYMPVELYQRSFELLSEFFYQPTRCPETRKLG